jgi:hypothetical protein
MILPEKQLEVDGFTTIYGGKELHGDVHHSKGDRVIPDGFHQLHILTEVNFH